MTQIRKTTLADKKSYLEFWLTKTPAERLQALEEIRFLYCLLLKIPTNKRIEKVVSIVKMK